MFLNVKKHISSSVGDYIDNSTFKKIRNQYTITLKMAARNFLPGCTAFCNRIPIDSLTIPDSNAMHLGKKFLAAIFSVINCLLRKFISCKIKELLVLWPGPSFLLKNVCCDYSSLERARAQSPPSFQLE